MPQESPLSFNEKVYALSKIVHRVKFRNNHSEKYTPSQRKHLRLLDDIALLLVTESSSDVAAVSFERRSTEIIFYFAKNRPATGQELKYINHLRVLTQNTEDPDQINSIFDEVLQNCRPKILSRFNKLLRVLADLPLAARWFRDDTNGDLDRHLESELGVWYDKQAGPAVFVNRFLSHLFTLAGAKSQQAPDLAALRQILRVAHATGSFKFVQTVDGKQIAKYTVYPHEPLATRMRLLGDYFGAVKRIVRNADSIIGMKAGNIRMEEVVPQSPVQSRMPADYLQIVNRYAIERGLNTISFETLKNAYPDTAAIKNESPATPSLKNAYAGATSLAPQHASRSQSVTYAVHAECTVAMFMASLSRSWKFVEIGCSKGSCWLCERYLAWDTRLKFHVSNVHRKLQPGWTIPPLGIAEVDAQVLKLIGDELEEVVLRAVRSKPGDSEPRSGSDSEKEAKEKAKEKEKNKLTPKTGMLYWA